MTVNSDEFINAEITVRVSGWQRNAFRVTKVANKNNVEMGKPVDVFTEN